MARVMGAPPTRSIAHALTPLVWADGLVVRRDVTGEALYASRPFDAGETLFQCRRITWRPERDRNTFENSAGHHMFDPILARTAHGCAPNSRLASDLMAVIARRDIAAGERISIDYAKTETALAYPFDCLCGAPSCRGRIG
jgi:hypothetical protein